MGRIRISIRVINWIRIRISLQMTSQSIWNMILFEHFFKFFILYLDARIRIRIRIKVKGRIQNRIISDKQDSDPLLLVLLVLILLSSTALHTHTVCSLHQIPSGRLFAALFCIDRRLS